MSLTYVGVIVFLLTYFFKLSGIEITVPEIQGIAENLLVLISAAAALYGRWRNGGLTWFGARK